jgi:hypothetical protein
MKLPLPFRASWSDVGVELAAALPKLGSTGQPDGETMRIYRGSV